MKAKAAVLYEYNTPLVVEDIEVGAPQQGEVMVKLVAAGVPSTARTVHGTPHAGDLGFVDIAPEVTAQTLASVEQFAKSVG